MYQGRVPTNQEMKDLANEWHTQEQRFDLLEERIPQIHRQGVEDAWKDLEMAQKTFANSLSENDDDCAELYKELREEKQSTKIEYENTAKVLLEQMEAGEQVLEGPFEQMAKRHLAVLKEYRDLQMDLEQMIGPDDLTDVLDHLAPYLGFFRKGQGEGKDLRGNWSIRYDKAQEALCKVSNVFKPYQSDAA
ncbi:hypothetical protein BT63DRAFT_450395 [Microthyrium microscopicum]|uniref:Uncharacterized protein n=1 Tax=Microthyrium microscopicum TaxID=703497 RepID=A0A6A6UTF8_9PEZI|nr:hypothetical protein BT63DRAFT_450395 [Microthyrium microscopicum]